MGSGASQWWGKAKSRDYICNNSARRMRFDGVLLCFAFFVRMRAARKQQTRLWLEKSMTVTAAAACMRHDELCRHPTTANGWVCFPSQHVRSMRFPRGLLRDPWNAPASPVRFMRSLVCMRSRAHQEDLRAMQRPSCSSLPRFILTLHRLFYAMEKKKNNVRRVTPLTGGQRS